MAAMDKRLLMGWLISFVTALSQISDAASESDRPAQQEQRRMNTSTDQEAKELGYVRLPLDLGGDVQLSFLAKDKSLTTPLAKADAIETPGRAELAKVFVPDDRDKFELTVSMFKLDFAGEAPAISEQLLMEQGFGITGASHASLTSADAQGETLDESKVAKVARSLCQIRQENAVCLFMQGDVEYKAEFEKQADTLLQSLRFEAGAEEGFASAHVKQLDLPLGDKGTLPLQYPSAFDVASNDFDGDLPGTLQLQQGSASNPLSVVMIAASAGAAPPSAEAIDSVADGMVGGWLEQNAKLFANPVLATKGDLGGLGSGDIGRTYAYIVDKTAGDGGKAQIRVSLFASGGVRYSVLMVTHYSPEVDETGAFFVRLGGVTGYDLVMRSILSQLQ
jgi:hypothetical protein